MDCRDEERKREGGGLFKSEMQGSGVMGLLSVLDLSERR